MMRWPELIRGVIPMPRALTSGARDLAWELLVMVDLPRLPRASVSPW